MAHSVFHTWKRMQRLAGAVGRFLEASSKRGHIVCFAWGLGAALVFTSVGAGIAALQGTLRQFLHEWVLLQGPPLVATGTWLLLVILSGVLQERIAQATRDGLAPRNGIRHRGLRLVLVGSIGMLGTASLIGLGFNGKGLVLVFFWFTCVCVCFTAARVTLHAIDMLLLVHRLQHVEIKTFHYAPARTQELRNLVNYFTSFTLLMTIGYAFAVGATFLPNWTGGMDYITAVRVFWPVLYVPACSIALVYPHFVVHTLIHREKERTLLLYHREIDDLLIKYDKLSSGEIERTNTLAQLFDRISATPNYVLDFGIGARTLLPLVFNLITLFARSLVSPS